MVVPRSAAVQVALVALLLTGASAGSSAAQTPVDSFTQLPGILKIGSVIYVEDDTGQRTKGKLRELSGSSLVLVASGRQERSFPADRLVRVTRVDSKLNGFLIGFAAGAVPGVGLGWGFNQLCYNESPNHCPGAFFISGGLLGALGGWIGWAIDGAIDGETLVFAQPRASSAAPSSSGSAGSEVRVPGRARPASTASSFTELRLLVKPGQTVSLTDASGRQIEGRIAELSPASVAVMVQGARLDFAESEVRQMERLGDPLWNGAVIGLGVGAGVGFVAGRIEARKDPGGFVGPIVGGAILLAGMTIGTATGVVVDALHKQRKLVYLTPKSRDQQGETRGSGPPAGTLITSRAVSKQRTGVSVSPLLGNDRRGVLVSVGF